MGTTRVKVTTEGSRCRAALTGCEKAPVVVVVVVGGGQPSKGCARSVSSVRQWIVEGTTHNLLATPVSKCTRPWQSPCRGMTAL